MLKVRKCDETKTKSQTHNQLQHRILTLAILLVPRGARVRTSWARGEAGEHSSTLETG